MASTRRSMSTLRMNIEKASEPRSTTGSAPTQEGLCVVRHDRAATEVARDRREGEVVVVEGLRLDLLPWPSPGGCGGQRESP